MHTAGSVGGSTAIVASQLVAAGIHERVLTVAFEKQSESDAMWALSMPIPFQPPLHAGAGGYFAPHIRSYMRRAKAPDHIGILVALKDRLNALKNPYAHLHDHEITFDSIKDSMMLWDPIRYDGDVPVVRRRLRHRVRLARRSATRPPPRAAPRRGSTARRCAPSRPCRPTATRCCRSAAPCAPRTSTARRASPTPAGRSTASRCTCRSPGSSRCGSRTCCFAEPGEGWKMVEEGATALDGDLPGQHERRRAVHQPDRRLRA